MLYLHVSNRTENLLAQLAALLEAAPQPDPFAGELFLIQSRGMERLIAQRMADSFSCFANFQFFLPLNCINYFSAQVGLTEGSAEGFEKDILAWRLEGLLRDLDGETFAPLRNYLSGDNVARKRLQLARRLGDLFDQYQIMRPAMLSAWEGGRVATAEPSERWQQQLWQRLIASGDHSHRGTVLARLIDAFAKDSKLPGLKNLPQRLIVFGVHSMPPVFLRFLGVLANHLYVHLFLLSPCQQFWGDAPTNKKQLAAQADSGLGSQIDNSLLVSLGRQGRDFQNMLLTDVQVASEIESYDEPAPELAYEQRTLLAKIQTDLLQGCAPRGSIVPQREGIHQELDDSLVIVSCHSRLRELQVLKDRILYLLEQDRELQLRDIVVMAPNIQDYSGLIPAVFADIQHSIADRSLGGQNQAVGAFMRFLGLLQGRFGWSEIIDFLRLPVVAPAFGLVDSDLEQLEGWVLDAGIRWGLSAGQREADGLAPFAESSWRFGLDRLLMGLAVDREEFTLGVLPYTGIEGKSGIALGALCQLYDLLESCHRQLTIELSLGGWSELLLDWIEQLWGRDPGQEVCDLRRLLLENGERLDAYHQHPVTFQVVYDWLGKLMEDSRSSSGFLRGQLMFCSMLPMRSIPFAVICLLGLNDGVFPKSDNKDTFDLMAASFLPGDRSPRADDRYQFLEAIVAARRSLVLSYVGQSAKNLDEIPPSVVVSELLELLKTGYGVAEPVIKHPLHAFSSRYFAKDHDTKLFRYDEHSYQTAVALAGDLAEDGPWWRGRLDNTSGQVSVGELLDFFRNPPKYFVRRCLGVLLDFGSEVPEDRELFEVAGLDSFWVGELLLGRALAGKPLEYAEAKASGIWPLGAIGEDSFQERRREIAEFAVKLARADMGQPVSELAIDIETALASVTGSLGNVYENGILLVRNGSLRGRDLLAGWLHHLLLASVHPAPRTMIGCRDELIEFGEIPETASLDRIIAFFIAGNRCPSTILPDPALHYAKQAISPSGKKSPMEVAEQSLQRSLTQGYEAEWALLFGSGEGVLASEEFEWFCHDVMVPVLSCCRRRPW